MDDDEYSDELLISRKEDFYYCRCPNQQFVTFDDICENCIMPIKRENNNQ